VRWVYRDGYEHVAGGYTLAGAKKMLADCGGKGFEPKAVEVLIRMPAPWIPLLTSP